MADATEVLRRRGTSAENNLFVGGEGELTIDLSSGTLRVHTGDNHAGGYALAREDLNNVQLSALAAKGVAKADMSNTVLSKFGVFAGTDDTETSAGGLAYKDLSNVSDQVLGNKGLAFSSLSNILLSAFNNFRGTDDSLTHAGGLAYKDLSNVSSLPSTLIVGLAKSDLSNVSDTDFANKMTSAIGSDLAKTNLSNTALSSYGSFLGTDDTDTRAGGLAFKDLSNVGSVSSAFYNNAGVARRTLANVTTASMNDAGIALKNRTNWDLDVVHHSFKNLLVNPRAHVNINNYNGSSKSAGNPLFDGWYVPTGATGSMQVPTDPLAQLGFSFTGSIAQTLNYGASQVYNRTLVLWATDIYDQNTGDSVENQVTVTVLDDNNNTIIAATNLAKTTITNGTSGERTEVFMATLDFTTSAVITILEALTSGHSGIVFKLTNGYSSALTLDNLQLELYEATTPEIRPYEIEKAISCATTADVSGVVLNQGNGITISNHNINVNYDNSSITLDGSGKLKSVVPAATETVLGGVKVAVSNTEPASQVNGVFYVILDNNS